MMFRKKIDLFTKNVIRLNSTFENSCIEVNIPVPWGKIAGKWWGPTNIKPILCLHGYQDNCGSFDRIIPVLSKVGTRSFLSIDFPGHGYSSRYPPGLTYEYINYVLVLKRIREYFKWPTISFMGHSYGAMIAFSYALFYPKEINYLICLDSMKLLEVPISADFLKDYVDGFIKYEEYQKNEETISFTIDELKEKISKAHKNSVKLEYAHYLLKRNLIPSKKTPGKFLFSRDPRLKLKLIYHWSQESIIKDINRITCPVFLIKCINSSYFEPKSNFDNALKILKESSSDCDFHYLDGTHHIHLNEPEKVGTLVNKFLDKYYTIENIEIKSEIFVPSVKTSKL